MLSKVYNVTTKSKNKEHYMKKIGNVKKCYRANTTNTDVVQPCLLIFIFKTES